MIFITITEEHGFLSKIGCFTMPGHTKSRKAPVTSNPLNGSPGDSLGDTVEKVLLNKFIMQ